MTEKNHSAIDPRGYIQLSGPDSRKFLQGQVTCDMDTLSSEQSICGAQCTPKGRIIFLFVASCDGEDNIVLETHSSITDNAIASLKKYAVFFKTEITDISGQIEAESVTDLQRLRTGSADITADTSDMFIPQMINLDALGYISFKKGCYTGQEIVARAHYRGAVKRRMHHLQLSAAEVPAPGTEILNTEGRAIGNIASAAQVDEHTVELLAVLADKSSDCTEIGLGEQRYAVTHLSLPYGIPTGP
jgi:folate-binding protein YgfZ